MTMLFALSALALGAADPTLDDIVQRYFKDASFVARIDSMNQSELTKIKKDFSTQYRVKESKIWVEEPHKIRIEVKLGSTDVLYIVNGAKRYVRIPRMNVKQTENNDDAPGKRQTFLDFGVLTPSLFADPFSAKFIRVDRATGDYVFDLTYQTPKYSDTSRHRVWVDPKTRITNKREWYSQGGRHLATFYYENPVSAAGCQFPTKVTVRNAEGKVGGVTSYVGVKVNAGIDNSLFKIN